MYLIFSSLFPLSTCLRSAHRVAGRVMTLRQANGCKQLTLTISLTLTLGLLQWPIGDVSGQDGLSPAQVLQELLTRYGDNTSISVPQLRLLLKRLNGGQSGEHDAQTQSTKTNASKVSQKG